MPQTVTIPGVGDVDFPDGMSDEAIATAIKRNYPHLSKPAGPAPDIFSGQKYLASQGAPAPNVFDSPLKGFPQQPLEPSVAGNILNTERNVKPNPPILARQPRSVTSIPGLDVLGRPAPDFPTQSLAEAKVPQPNFLQVLGRGLQEASEPITKPLSWLLENVKFTDPDSVMSALNHGESIDDATKGHSLADLDRATDLSGAISGMDLQKRYGVLGGIGEGVVQGIHGLIRPSNIMLAAGLGPLAELGGGARAALGLGFGVPMVAGGGGKFLEGVGSGNAAQATEGVITGGLGALAGSHGIREAGRILKNPPANGSAFNGAEALRELDDLIKGAEGLLSGDISKISQFDIDDINNSISTLLKGRSERFPNAEPYKSVVVETPPFKRPVDEVPRLVQRNRPVSPLSPLPKVEPDVTTPSVEEIAKAAEEYHRLQLEKINKQRARRGQAPLLENPNAIQESGTQEQVSGVGQVGEGVAGGVRPIGEGDASQPVTGTDKAEGVGVRQSETSLDEAPIEPVRNPFTYRPQEIADAYHGSSRPITVRSEFEGYHGQNLYGPGFYTTDNPDLATSYTKKGGGKEPSMYRVEWAGDKPPNFLDMEQPLPTELHDVFEANNPLHEKLDVSKPAGEVYKQLKEHLEYEGVTRDEAEEILSGIQHDLKRAGYDGLAHVGGKIKGKVLHNVKIIFGDELDGVPPIKLTPEGLRVKTEPVRNSDSAPPERILENPPVSGFTTEKGSTYEVHEDGTTTRNKAARNDPGHEGESGPQRRSERTVYVTEAEGLAAFQATHPNSKSRIVFDEKTKSVAVALVDRQGGMRVFKDTITPYSETPEVGKTPVETWDGGDKAHFGNKIVNVSGGRRILKNPPVEPPNGDTTGIARRITQQPSGEGAAPGEALESGKARIAAGEDPVQHLAMMKARGNVVSGEDVGLLHAHRNALRVTEDRAYDALRKNLNDPTLRKAYEDAHDAVTAWDKDIKPYQTEFQKIGMAMQGETDLDTGSFTSLRHAFEDRAGRTMTPTEERMASQHSERVAGLEKQVEDLQAKVDEALRKQIERRGTKSTGKLPTDSEGLREHFQKRIEDGSLFRQPKVTAPKGSSVGAVNPSTAPNFTPQEVAAIWNHAKTYIDRGVKFADMISGVASDLGLEPEWVYKALAADKTTRIVTDAMYKQMSDRRSAVNAAKLFVETANMAGYQKVWRSLTAFPRSVAVFGHGGVGMVTHAGPNIFRPSMFTTYWRNFFRQVPFTVNKAFHERIMSNLENDPNFIMWKRAGLKVDPNTIYDDYQSYGKVIGGIGKAGNRGMDALKTFRLETANRLWESMPDNIKAEPDAAETLAEWVNHASGSGSLGHGRIADIASEALFAGSLEASRWARVLGDPIKTVRDLTIDRKTSTPAEKYVAGLRIKKASELVATYTGLLLANYGLNAAMGVQGNQNVNLTDPTKSDWMLFKFAGKGVDATGNALAPLRFMASLIATSTGLQPTYKGQSKSEQFVSDAGFYARGKLAPQYGIAVDIASQRDIMGRPIPFSTAKPTEAKPAYDPLEYGLEHGPIPFAAGAKELYQSLRERGISHDLATAILKGFATGGVELTGIKLKEPPKEKLGGGH